MTTIYDTDDFYTNNEHRMLDQDFHDVLITNAPYSSYCNLIKKYCTTKSNADTDGIILTNWITFALKACNDMQESDVITTTRDITWDFKYIIITETLFKDITKTMEDIPPKHTMEKKLGIYIIRRLIYTANVYKKLPRSLSPGVFVDSIKNITMTNKQSDGELNIKKNIINICEMLYNNCGIVQLTTYEYLLKNKLIYTPHPLNMDEYAMTYKYIKNMRYHELHNARSLGLSLNSECLENACLIKNNARTVEYIINHDIVTERCLDNALQCVNNNVISVLLKYIKPTPQQLEKYKNMLVASGVDSSMVFEYEGHIRSICAMMEATHTRTSQLETLKTMVMKSVE